MNWAELLNQIAHWQKKTFPETTVKGARAHLEREVTVELMQSPHDAEEWADALFMCIQGGTLAAGSLNKFRMEVHQKLAKNQERKWPDKPDADNVYEHLEMDTLEDTPGMSRKVVRNPNA